ncbi:MAG TPA: Calx-beta domain-containing protein [Leptolyngbyaceae cyanobacterium]
MAKTLHQSAQIAFIDSNVSDRETLINNIFSDIQVVILDANRDGVEQITEVLSGGNYSAIHIISHGSSNNLQLGIAQLNSENLTTSYEASIAKWRDSLTPNADILLYGCKVVENNQSLIEKIARLTGADVAASDDFTGNSALGGDWDLEIKTGLIETPLAFQIGVMETYNAVLGTTINVTNISELIQAINDANSEVGIYAGADTINLAAGTYTLTSASDTSDTNWGKTGLPRITSQITINGNGAVIDGGFQDWRIFRVDTAVGNLALNDITVQNARVQTGIFGGDAGALLNTGGIITINNSTFTGNQANDDGGAIVNFQGTITIENSTISNNKAQGGGTAGGGGIENQAGTLNLINSTISNNISEGSGTDGGGGIRNRGGGIVQITNSTIAFNKATTNGGGLLNIDGNVTVSNSLITRNTFNSNLNVSGADVAGTFSSSGYNLIGNADGGSGFTSTGDITGTSATLLDPLLASLANYGGSTQTHALLPGSPAIDAGTNASATDQRGITRPVSGTADIGAFESQGFTVTITGGNNQNTLVNTTFTNPLNLTVSSAFSEPVDGGQISYTLPGSGASATINTNPATIAGGTVSVNATANGTAGTYSVTAGGKGIATSANYTLTNNPDFVTVSIDSPTIIEGTGGTKNLAFTISISGATTVPVSVDYGTVDASAKAGSDYTTTTGNVNFIVGGSTTQTVNIPITTDNTNEAEETLQVQLSNAVNAIISPTAGTGTGTIQNDDIPSVSITPVSGLEGTGVGTTTANFTVNLSNPTDIPITVNYSTANGTANSPTDYTAATGTLTFDNLSGTSQNIVVNITRDDIYEPDETFTVNLTNTGASNATASATGTITNDDSLPQISIGDVTVTEGNSSTTKATFTVKLSNPSTQAVTVNYATSNGTATTADSDYTPILSTPITFAAGETEKTIDILVNGDTTFETDETFNVNLTGASNATISDATGLGTITNDDIQPTISIDDVTVTEGNSGTTTATFTVTLSTASTETVTVNYATADGTAKATDSDYTSIPTNSVTFAPGETKKTIDVAITGDTIFEANETFNINLSGANNATIADNQGLGTITNDDTQPTISINDVSVAEGNSGTTKATFTVKLSNASSETVTVNYATADGTATIADSDYTAIPSTTLTLAAGETEKTIDVFVNSDTKFETDETFNVNLTGANNATIADATGVGTITNDDTKPTVSISPTNITNPEGNSGTAAYTYNVTLSNASNQTVTVNYSTNDGTATVADNDYIDNDGNLTFNPGDPLTKTITVNVNSDSKFESDENFTVKLNSAANADLGTITQATGTITNDDIQPTVAISPATITNNEGNSGITAYTYTITLSSPTSQSVNVNYSTNDGTATVADNDYADNDGNLIFNPGDPLTKTITVNVNGDNKFESDENFTVRLNSATNATIGASFQATGTIINDDSQPTISINDVTHSEGKSGNTNFDFTVTLSSVSSLPVSVSYSTADGSATAGSDYNPIPATQLTFNPGETSKTISVAVNGDPLIESDETFFVNLFNPTNGIIADNQGVGTITNDDNAPTVSNIDKSGNEDSDISFSVADFTNKFSDVDGDSLSKIKITSLPSNGTLNLGGSNVTANQEIVAGDLGNLRFTPNVNWNGSTSFGWNGFDGNNYANSGAIVNLTVNPVNDAPFITIPITSKTATVSDLFNFTFPADTFQDIDVGDNLSYTATLVNGNPLPNWLFFNPFTRNFVGIPNASDVGTFTLLLTAIDNAGASVTNPFNLTVTNPDPNCFCEQIIRPSLDSLAGLDTNPNLVDITQFGTNDNDTLMGTDVREEFYGFDGDDLLLGNVGTDNLIGNFGNDTSFGGGDRDWISGNSGDDIINGNEGNDIINGNEGNDIARGGEGNDLVRGGQNDDILWGDLGDDTLGGDKGNDTVFGGTSELDSTDGRDLIFGGTGNDLLNGNASNDTLFGEDGNDTVRGGQNDDIVCGGSGDDMLFGDRGNDSLCAGDGNDSIYGGNGSDFAIGANGERDYLCGGLGNDWLFGNEGEDWLNGEAGDDTLFGGKDNDTLIGGADNDRLIGDLGNDFLTGGSGSDLFILAAGKGSDVIADFQDNQDLFGLSGGMTFQDLAISQSSDRTFINLKSNGELLVTLYAVQANAIEQSDFISVI